MAKYGLPHPPRQTYDQVVTYDPNEPGAVVRVTDPPSHVPDHLRVVEVHIDTNGDGIADVTRIARPSQLDGKLDYGGADPTAEFVQTDFGEHRDDPGRVESSTQGSFSGETVVVPPEAFAQFLGRLDAAIAGFDADGPLRSIDVGPGNTPQGAVLKRKLNTESGEITKTYIETAQEMRRRLTGLANDLRAMSQNYQQGQESI
ncbi:MAG TPA: hypothetical protein VD813_05380, partial [Pseudonocardia sp.]|nr:hypothetical protein [Pseudonocardia sp.]